MIQNIIAGANLEISSLERQAEKIYFKDPAYDNLMMDAALIKNTIKDIEIVQAIPGVIEKLDRNEKMQKLFVEFQKNSTAFYLFLEKIKDAAAETVLWAKKMSWIGDWDFNYNGKHTIFSVSLRETPEGSQFEKTEMDLFTGRGINPINFKIDVKTSQSKFNSGIACSFDNNWNDFKFLLCTDKGADEFISKVFQYERSKFAGVKLELPFYGEQTTEFFGKDYI